MMLLLLMSLLQPLVILIAKARLKWTIFTNAVKLEQAGLKKKILPFLIVPGEKVSSSIVDPDGFVWIDGSSISVFGKESGRVKPAITKEVNWRLTLRGFEKLVKGRDDITLFSNGEKEKSIKEFKSVNGEARHGVKSGRDEDMDKKQTNADNDAKKILTEYYSTLQSQHIEIPFRLKPIVDTEKGVKAHSTYYFGEPTADKPLNIRNGQNKPVAGKALAGLMKTIRWMDTFTTLLDGFEYMEKYMHENNDISPKKNIDANLKIMNEVLHEDQLQKLHDESEAAYQKYGEAMKRYEAANEAVKGNNSKAATSAMKATNTLFQIKAQVYNDKKKELEGSRMKRKLTGRGLRGAGVAPLEGVVRRGRTYNLNEIQGLATPSVYVYHQLGSKYIRIPDLDAKTLVIVQPNRWKCGPKREISDQLQAMIRTLAFKQHIDQSSYDKLSIDDKKLFKEILAITHLQYNFHDRLEDPLESLRAEYDKLKGELELGNDNPSIIKQLKSLSVDMYSNRLISDSEFKDIIVRLI
ncbi:hypothetical protein PC110_g17620 [Phytophthora cactorum]|uniref:Uncharacterized protein n=1 Tax=Phytophthora cactorum TaxID=29920 RepID=A0A329RML7_9STRA|nr:hypothetical protein PC110_g17620 [Phytophthora cactorum]